MKQIARQRTGFTEHACVNFTHLLRDVPKYYETWSFKRAIYKVCAAKGYVTLSVLLLVARWKWYYPKSIKRLKENH